MLDCSTLKDEGNMFFYNSGNNSPRHTAPHPTTPKSLTTPLSAFQTLQTHVLFICILELAICDFLVFQEVASDQLWFHFFFLLIKCIWASLLILSVSVLPSLVHPSTALKNLNLFTLNPSFTALSALPYTFLLPFFTLLLGHWQKCGIQRYSSACLYSWFNIYLPILY